MIDGSGEIFFKGKRKKRWRDCRWRKEKRDGEKEFLKMEIELLLSFKLQSYIYLIIYIDRCFSRSVHSVFNLFFFLHTQNSYNNRVSNINTIKIELPNKYSMQRKLSVVTSR